MDFFTEGFSNLSSSKENIVIHTNTHTADALCTLSLSFPLFNHLSSFAIMPDTLETSQHFIFVTQVYFCCASCSLPDIIFYTHFLDFLKQCMPSFCGTGSSACPESGNIFGKRPGLRLKWHTCFAGRVAGKLPISYLTFHRYWVIAVVPYLLYAFVNNHSLETCQRIYKIPVALAMWNQVGSESVLLIRTYAFFNRNKLVLVGLLCALGGMVAYQLYVDTSQMLVLPFVTPPFNQGPCFPMSKPHSAHLLGFFIAPLGFDTIVTFMTVCKAFYVRRRNGGPSSRLIQTFLREGVFYYLLISIANLINGIFYLQPRQAISAINIPLSVMLSPVLACRLILDLRERGSETVTHSDGHTFNSHGSRGLHFGIQFSQHRSAAGSGNSGAGCRKPRPYCGKSATINSGAMLSTISSDLGAIGHDNGVELNGLHHKASGDMCDDEIEDFKAADVNCISGIRVDVEKTSNAI